METSKPTVIRPAAASDLDQIRSLLQRSELPLDGIREFISTMIVAEQEGHIVGTAALETYEGGALLRSVAVDATRRGGGLGQRLTLEILALGKRLGHTRIFLLTETAVDFFPRFGFSAVERAAIPESVKKSIEFTTACPESALAMELSLDREQSHQ